MADSILRLQVESQEYDAKLKRATEGLQRYVDGCRKVGGTLEVVEKETLDYVKAIGQMETVSRSATGKLSEMKRAFTELSMQYKQMTDAERQSPVGKALSQSLDQLNGRITETKRQMDEVSRDMNGGGGLGGALDALAGKFGLSISQLAGWGAAIGAATGAVSVAKDAFFQSESNIDEWNRTVKGAEGAYTNFLNTLNGGNWSNFFSNMSTAVRGTRDLYDALDRLGSIKGNNQAAIAIVRSQIATLRLAKQRGENVDDQIKSATAQLAALQKEGTDAGKVAGRTMVEEIIRNTYNTQKGANPLSGGSLRNAAGELIRQGQKAFDKYRGVYERLGAKATETIAVSGPSVMGGTTDTQTRVNLKKLTDEERKQYLLSKAITEAETRIQEGLALYGNAVTEESSNAREIFRDNRYALTGKSGGSGSGKGGGSTTTDPITKAADEVVKAEQSYAESINVAQEKLMANVMKSEEYDKLVLSGQERLADAYLKAYNTTGNDKYLDAFRETSEHILDMRGVVDANIQAQKLAEQATREQAEAAKKLAEAERKRSEQYANWHSNSTSGIANYISYQQGLLGQQSIGSGDYAQVASNLADANAYKNLMQVAIQNGLNDLVVDAAPLWQKIIGEVDVQDSTWKELQDNINAKLKKLGIEPIKIDFATGSLSGESKGGEKHENQIGKVVSGMTSITNSLQHIGVEIPEGFNKVVNIMNIIQTIMTTVGSFGSAGSFLSGIPLIGGFFSLFGLANGGVVHAANGFSGIVPGNLMSGDQVPALLNSGEVVLNRAQAGVLASDMRQGNIGYEGRTQAVIESDQIKLVLHNGAQSRGMTLSDYLEL